jgi:hypothetical protein
MERLAAEIEHNALYGSEMADNNIASGTPTDKAEVAKGVPVKGGMLMDANNPSEYKKPVAEPSSLPKALRFAAENDDIAPQAPVTEDARPQAAPTIWNQGGVVMELSNEAFNEDDLQDAALAMAANKGQQIALRGEARAKMNNNSVVKKMPQHVEEHPRFDNLGEEEPEDKDMFGRWEGRDMPDENGKEKKDHRPREKIPHYFAPGSKSNSNSLWKTRVAGMTAPHSTPKGSNPNNTKAVPTGPSLRSAHEHAVKRGAQHSPSAHKPHGAHGGHSKAHGSQTGSHAAPSIEGPSRRASNNAHSVEGASRRATNTTQSVGGASRRATNDPNGNAPNGQRPTSPQSRRGTHDPHGTAPNGQRPTSPHQATSNNNLGTPSGGNHGRLA